MAGADADEVGEEMAEEEAEPAPKVWDNLEVGTAVLFRISGKTRKGTIQKRNAKTYAIETPTKTYPRVTHSAVKPKNAAEAVAEVAQKFAALTHGDSGGEEEEEESEESEEESEEDPWAGCQ
eukprot:SAG25_NODE_1133_length_3837_cov_10.869984_3_plen_122_part_00